MKRRVYQVSSFFIQKRKKKKRRKRSEKKKIMSENGQKSTFAKHPKAGQNTKLRLITFHFLFQLKPPPKQNGNAAQKTSWRTNARTCCTAPTACSHASAMNTTTAIAPPTIILIFQLYLQQLSSTLSLVVLHFTLEISNTTNAQF